MRRLLIVNPFATGVDAHRLEAVLAALPEGTETRLTTAAGEASEIARGVEDVAAVYVLGGDGTYNEVLNGLTADVPLGFLPGGGTSVLPRALGLSRNPVQAAKRVAEVRLPVRHQASARAMRPLTAEGTWAGESARPTYT